MAAFIFILHIALLGWIWTLLSKGGQFSMGQLIIHFTAMSIYGGGLIAFSSYCARNDLI
jgi:hypothetical protein